MKKPASAAAPDMRVALSAYRTALIGIFLISGVINILYLTGSLFMLEVYDRVLPSRSVPTLIGLALIVAGLFVFQGVLDMVRARVLVRLGAALDESLGPRAYDAVLQHRLRAGSGRDGLQPVRDLEQIRSFLSSSGPGALFDLPWMPFYLAICFAFHFLIGLAALAGALVLILLTIATEVLTRGPSRKAAAAMAERNALAESSRRNAESLVVLGMAPMLRERWRIANEAQGEAHRRTSDVAGDLGATAKTLRLMLQSAVLGVGAWLVINGEASAGIIIASSILTARALAPVDLAIAHWKNFVAARQSWGRLRAALVALPAAGSPLPLPAPTGTLSVECVSVVPPGGENVVARDISFELKKGEALAIVGPSGSGKSSLARALVGIWTPVHGKVRLDGAALDQWLPEALGPHIGYLPQDIELFDGTVSENIARFTAEPNSAAIIAAATAAGVHELILRLPEGYATQLGDAGLALSGGQRQRIALARALYGEPFLVVLDEPNSNLDAEGEQALGRAISGIRQRGGVAIIVSHRSSALAPVDHVLVLVDGKVQAMGPKAKMFPRPVAIAVDAVAVAEPQRAAS